MNITVVGGTGYVGLTTASCLAYERHRVYCVGRNEEKVRKINMGIPIIHEENLENILKIATLKGRLTATTHYEKPILDSSVVFLCVGTPSRKDGAIDLSQLKEAAKKTGRVLQKKEDYCVIVVKSTVIPGTTEKVVIPILEKYSGKSPGEDFGVCMNPEFLREGSAINDFRFPKDQGIVIGELDRKSGDILFNLYQDFEAEVFRTTLRTAEMIKYARNSYLAKDISFANEIANICQKLDVDYLEVKKGMELDTRIGKGRFLNAGIGFGGSCFPKDVKALIAKAKEINLKPKILEATLAVNESQPLEMIDILEEVLGSLEGKKIAVLGLAFKKGTDDMRESRSIPIIERLLQKDVTIYVFDPEAMISARRIFGSHVFYKKTAKDALKEAEACLIATDWPQFSDPNLYDSLKGRVIIDCRRVLDPEKIAPSFIYRGVGFPVKT